MKPARLAIAIAYPVLLVMSSLNFASPVLQVLLLIAPLALLLNVGIARFSNSRYRLMLRIATGFFVVMAGVALFRLHHESLQGLVVLQECGFLLLMAGIFGVTLINGEDALCTRFVRFAQKSPSVRLIRYSRQITAAWALFFVISAAISTALYFSQPMHVWALYNSVGIPICAVFFFCLENLSQKFFLPREERKNLLEVWAAIRAVQSNSRPLGRI